MRLDFSAQRFQSAINDAVSATGKALAKAGSFAVSFPNNVADAYLRPRGAMWLSDKPTVVASGTVATLFCGTPLIGPLLNSVIGGSMVALGKGEERAKGYEILGATAFAVGAGAAVSLAGLPLIASIAAAGVIAAIPLGASTIIDAFRPARGDIG